MQTLCHMEILLLGGNLAVVSVEDMVITEQFGDLVEERDEFTRSGLRC